jgi:hypothetical protein
MSPPFNSLYIKGRTKVNASFTDGEGKYGTSIYSYKLSVEGKTYEDDPYTSEYLLGVGDIKVTGIVTDLRRISREYTQTITVMDYSEPQLIPASWESQIVCARCEADGKLSESGAYLKIRARRSYSALVSNGVQNNFCSIRYRLKEESGGTFSEWKTILDKNDTTADTVDIIIPNVVSSIETAYVVQLGVVDDMGNTATIQYMIPTAFTTVDIPDEYKGRRIGFFRYVSDTDKDGAYFGLPIFGGSVDSLKIGVCLLATSTSPINLNDLKLPDCYYSPGADCSRYILNTPYIAGGFGLEVRELNSENHLRQTLYYDNVTLIRYYNGSEWSEWDRVLMASDMS